MATKQPMVSGKIKEMATFSRLVEYVLRQGRHRDLGPPALAGTQHLSSDLNYKHLAYEMMTTAKHARALQAAAGAKKQHIKTTKTPCRHEFFSYPTGYVPTPEECRQDVMSYLKALGLEEHEVVFAAHADTDNFHVHMAINQVNPVTGKKYDNTNDALKADAWCKAWMQSHGYTYEQDEHEKSAKSRGEYEERKRLKKEVFAAIKNKLHDAMALQQSAELSKLAKNIVEQIKKDAWKATAGEADDVKRRISLEDKFFMQPTKVKHEGYWTTETVTKVGKNGRIYARNRQKWNKARTEWVYPTFWQRRAWLRDNRDRFAAAGLKPPTFWQSAWRGSFNAALKALHEVETKQVLARHKEAAKAYRQIIIDDRLAHLKQRNSLARKSISADDVLLAASVLGPKVDEIVAKAEAEKKAKADGAEKRKRSAISDFEKKALAPILAEVTARAAEAVKAVSEQPASVGAAPKAAQPRKAVDAESALMHQKPARSIRVERKPDVEDILGATVSKPKKSTPRKDTRRNKPNNPSPNQ